MSEGSALITDEQQLELLLDALADCALFTLDAAGQVASWNDSARRITGYEAEEVAGQHGSLLFPANEGGAGLERALEAARSGGRAESEARGARKDKTQFWASLVVDVILDDGGAVAGFAVILRDVTERRDAQDMIERTRGALAQSQKMEAIGQLTGGIAHDFNNLLTVITSNLDLILQDKSDPVRIERLARAAQRAVDRSAKLTQQLLAFGRRQSLRPETVDPNTLIGGLEALLHRACGESVELDLQLHAGIPPIRIDPAQFEAALLNLAFNARDAMPQGGALHISTDVIDGRDGRAAAVGLPPGRYALVSVADDGTGMTQEVQERAFEPFFTTKEPGKGSGLGLSQVYGFVNQSGGHVTIDSQPGGGTTVRLYLPAGEIKRSAGREEPAAAPRRGTVLVVEDDPDVLQSTVDMVRALGYEVLTAADGVAALAVLRRNVPINILFSDVVMPRGINGVELAREARKLRPGLRVILSSGYASTILTSEHGLTQDFVFIGKPYRWPDLAEKLRGGTMH